MGQVIGGIVAETQAQAQKAAQLVSVTYEDLPRIITIEVKCSLLHGFYISDAKGGGFFFFFFLRTRGICYRLVTRERRGYFAPLPSFVSPCLRSPHAFPLLAWLSPHLRWPGNAEENAAFPAG